MVIETGAAPVPAESMPIPLQARQLQPSGVLVYPPGAFDSRTRMARADSVDVRPDITIIGIYDGKYFITGETAVLPDDKSASLIFGSGLHCDLRIDQDYWSLKEEEALLDTDEEVLQSRGLPVNRMQNVTVQDFLTQNRQNQGWNDDTLVFSSYPEPCPDQLFQIDANPQGAAVLTYGPRADVRMDLPLVGQYRKMPDKYSRMKGVIIREEIPKRMKDDRSLLKVKNTVKSIELKPDSVQILKDGDIIMIYGPLRTSAFIFKETAVEGTPCKAQRSLSRFSFPLGQEPAPSELVIKYKRPDL